MLLNQEQINYLREKRIAISSLPENELNREGRATKNLLEWDCNE